MPINLPALLRRIVGRGGLSYSDLATVAGLGRMQVYRVVNGQNPNPSFRLVERIVEAAGGTMAELVADDEDTE